MNKNIAIVGLFILGNIAFAAYGDNSANTISSKRETSIDGNVPLQVDHSSETTETNSIDALTADVPVPSTLENEEVIEAVTPPVMEAATNTTPSFDATPTVKQAIVTNDTAQATPLPHETNATSTIYSVPQNSPPLDNALDKLTNSSNQQKPSDFRLHNSSVTHRTPWTRPEFEFGILAGGSGAYIPVNENLRETGHAPAAPTRFRFELSGEGVSTGATFGAMYRRGNTTFGGTITGYLDTHNLKNYDLKRDSYSTDTNHSMTFLDRSYTLEFAGKIGRYFEDYHVYGKLGVMCSAFQYKYRSIPEVDATHNITAWGGTLGVGIERGFNLPAIGESKIGLQYNYQLYETLTPIVQYTDNISKSKLRPRYHNGYLTITKTF